MTEEDYKLRKKIEYNTRLIMLRKQLEMIFEELGEEVFNRKLVTQVMDENKPARNKLQKLLSDAKKIEQELLKVEKRKVNISEETISADFYSSQELSSVA